MPLSISPSTHLAIPPIPPPSLQLSPLFPSPHLISIHRPACEDVPKTVKLDTSRDRWRRRPCSGSGMTPNGVHHSIVISEAVVHGRRDETIPSTPTTPSPKKKAIGKRRRRVDALLRKRGRDGNPVISSARDMQCALEDGVEVDHTTVTRDIVATGAHQSHKKTI